MVEHPHDQTFFAYGIRYVWTGRASPKMWSSVCRSAAASERGEGSFAAAALTSKEKAAAAMPAP
jgi:hypothetical protein